MQDFLIGRQQIFDRDLKIFAYELLFRDAHGKGPGEIEATWASNQVIVNSLLEEGLERVVGPYRAFINFTRDNLLHGTAQLLPKDKVVVEILESVAVDDAIVEAVSGLAREGYTIALDDFVLSKEWIPLIRLAHIVKLDILALTPETGRRYIRELSRFKLKFLAEKVETREQYTDYREMGCDYFQGFLFSRPNLVQGKKIGAGQHAVIRLLAEINRNDIEIADLTASISRDAGLSYRLLRYINGSSLFRVQQQIESITHAILLLGIKEVRRWANLVALASFPDTPKALMILSLSRAKMCECLAILARRTNSDEYFLTGLMSLLDQMLGVELHEVIDDLPLSGEVIRALVDREGELGEALRCTIEYECWHVDALRFRDLSLADIGQAYIDSVAWANEIAQDL
jgi:EAL and modified HD-GYP domain-containing signal transduction protein